MSPERHLCLQDTQMGWGQEEESTSIRECRMDLLSVTDVSNLLTKMRQLPIKAVIPPNRM